MTYTVDRILKIMEKYHIYRRQLNEQGLEYASVGVSIVSDMPMSTGISDNVANEAIRKVDDIPLFNTMRTDMKYIEDRLGRVECGRHKEVMYHRLDGMTIRDIAKVTGYSKSHIHRLLVEVAKCINGTD